VEQLPTVSETENENKNARTPFVWRTILCWTLGLAFMALCAYVYYRGAAYNAEFVNRNSSLGDQSSYMEYARDIYHNRHDPDSNVLGDRNRMPGYPFIQSFFYDAAKSDQIVPQVSLLKSLFGKPKIELKGRASEYAPERDREFFDRGKSVNIYLSIVLLIILFFIFRFHIPTLAATSITLVLAFGVFIFKAGYFQAELLFYFAFFISFLLMFHTLRRPSPWLGALAGVAAGLAHLIKAGMLPILCIFVAVYMVREIVLLAIRIFRPTASALARQSRFIWRIVTLALTLVCFLATLWPYIQTSKRVFSQYFYNVNSTFYIWYDNWKDVDNPKTGTKAHGDRVGWPDLPQQLLPSASKYWHEHTTEQIQSRLSKGFGSMLRESYDHFWFLKYVCLYLLLTIAIIVSRPIASCRGVASGWKAVVLIFFCIYCAAYLFLIAFYAPISASGTTRFLLANMAPLLFTLAYFSTRERLKATTLRLNATRLTPMHFHGAVIVMMLADIPFAVWPRLMDAAKFGGF